MKAAVQRTFGGPEAIALEDVPDPTVGSSDVLVKVHACAVNRLDILQRIGPPVVPNFSLPHIAGMDVAGEVVAVGRDVSEVAVGDRVILEPFVTCGTCRRCRSGLRAYCENLRTIGSTRPGGYAELVVAPARNCVPWPSRLSAVEAASLPVCGLTAWHSVVKVGQIKGGETMFVHGGGSGVSVAAIQFAKALGARVITTVSSAAKVAAAEALGVDTVIDRSTTPWLSAVLEATDGEGVDLVFDHVGAAVFAECVQALRVEGRMVFAGTTTGTDATFDLRSAYHHGRALLGCGNPDHGLLAELVAEHERFELRPVIDSVWGLDDYAAAQARMESSSFFGKVVLSVTDWR